MGEASQLHLPQAGNRLDPAKDAFDAGPKGLTDRIAIVAGRPPVNRAAAGSLEVLTDMRRDTQGTRVRDEAVRVVVLVRTEGAPRAHAVGLEHLHGRVALGGARRPGGDGLHPPSRADAP